MSAQHRNYATMSSSRASTTRNFNPGAPKRPSTKSNPTDDAVVEPAPGDVDILEDGSPAATESRSRRSKQNSVHSSIPSDIMIEMEAFAQEAERVANPPNEELILNEPSPPPVPASQPRWKSTQTENYPFDMGQYNRRDGILRRRTTQFSGAIKQRPPGIDGDPWGIPHQTLEKHDNEMCQAWNDEIQNLLIFTGLFAATVTAFTIESYQWLESDPAETTAKMLTQISLQLANLTDPITHNPTLTSSLSFDPEPRKAYAVGVNVMWFLSLSVSLTTVLIGVLCLQWLREYQRDAQSMLPKDAISLRQLRYTGLINWNVPQIISILPLFLQVAVVLFFIGLVQLLYQLDRVVAALIMPVVLMVPLVLIGTAIAPVMQISFMFGTNPGSKSQCPYKSPQGWWCYRLLRTPMASIMKLFNRRDSAICASFGKCDTWIDLDECWEKEMHFFVREPAPEELPLDNSAALSQPAPGESTTVSDTILLQPRVKYIRDAVLWTIETWGHRNDIFEMVRTMLPSLTMLELHFIAIHFDPNIFYRHSPRAVSGVRTMLFDLDIRGCVEFSILLFLPKVSWSMNPGSADYMMEQFRICATHVPASFALLVPFHRLSNTLYRFYNKYADEPSRRTMAIPLSSMITLCHVWVEMGVFKKDQWEGDFEPWLAHFTPKRLLWRLIMEVLAETKKFKFFDDHEATMFGLRLGVAGEDGRLGPNMDEMESCLVGLWMSQHHASWDPKDREKYVDIVKAYAMNLSTTGLALFESENYREIWQGSRGEETIEWEWLVGLTVAIQAVATQLLVISQIENACPEWKVFYELVVEEPYPVESTQAV